MSRLILAHVPNVQETDTAYFQEKNDTGSYS